jgi:hypothetical protein
VINFLGQSKKYLCKIKRGYQKKIDNLHRYLDNELNYLNSQLYYTEQQKITSLTMEYEAYKFNNQIHSLSSMPEPAIEEIIRVNKRITEHTWGVILESEKVSNLNVYIAQMNKVQINARQANFFIVTDSEDILLKLHDVFNWMNKVFYIVPNTYNSNIEEEYRPSINFHCLKHLDKHISTPGSTYMKMLKDIGGKQVTVPNPQRVFAFNCKRLVPEA